MRSTRALSISVGTHCVILAFLLLAFKHELLHKTPERQKSLPHQARVLLQNNKPNQLVPTPPSNPAPASAPAQSVVGQQTPPQIAAPPVQQQVTAPPVAAQIPTQIPYIPQQSKPLAKPHAQGAVPIVTEDTTTPPSQQQTPALRSPQGVVGRMHAWKRAAQKQSATREHTPARPPTRTQVAQQQSPYAYQATHAKESNSNSEASRAYAAAARLNKEFSDRVLHNYIIQLGNSICAKQNNNPIVVTPRDVPRNMMVMLLIDNNGELLDIQIEGMFPTTQSEQVRQHLLNCIRSMSPFRPLPPGAPKPFTVRYTVESWDNFTDSHSMQRQPFILSGVRQQMY